MAEPPFLPQLDTLLTDGRFAEAAALLDEQELLRDDLVMSVAADQAATMASWPHAVHMLSLIAAGRLTDARFLRKRLPPVAAEDAEVQAAWTLLQCLWQNKYAEVSIWDVSMAPYWNLHKGPVMNAIELAFCLPSAGLCLS